LVMTLFAVMASMTTCLMVRLDSGFSIFNAEDSATAFLPFLGRLLVYALFCFSYPFSESLRSRMITAPDGFNRVVNSR
jgi:hypothetical protein